MQDVSGVIGATYRIDGWMRGNSVQYSTWRRVSPTASTDWATAMDFSPPQTITGNYWTNFSGTVVATGAEHDNLVGWPDHWHSSEQGGMFEPGNGDVSGANRMAGA